MHVYRLILTRDEHSIDYATIIETHHPAYLTEADVRQLYPTGDAVQLDPETTRELAELVLQLDY